MCVFPLMVFIFFYELVLGSSEFAVAKLPQRITTLSGSCVQIPCRFNGSEISFKSTESMFGVWIKNNLNLSNPESLVVFNGTLNITKGFSRILMIGNLSQSECTTVFYDVMNNHSDNYYFNVETNTPGQRYTYQNPIYISVSDEPQPLVLKPTDLKEVMEETTVNLSCSVEAPCPEQPPKISWSNIPESANITTQLLENPDKTQLVFSHTTLKASYMDHRKKISCTATYPRKTANDSAVETTVMLRVLFPPKETHITIDPSELVAIGSNVILTCKSKANPSNNMNFFWHKRGQENPLDFGEQLTFTVHRKSGGWYFCRAKNEYGIQTSEEIQLIVAESLSLIIGSVVGVSSFLFIFLLITLLLRLQRVKASIIRDTDFSDQCLEKQEQISSITANSVFASSEGLEMPKNENDTVASTIKEIDVSKQGLETQAQINSTFAYGAFASSEELEMPKDENDTFHYGEIDFSNPQTKSSTVESSEQETIYAEVKGPEKGMNQD